MVQSSLITFSHGVGLRWKGLLLLINSSVLISDTDCKIGTSPGAQVAPDTSLRMCDHSLLPLHLKNLLGAESYAYPASLAPLRKNMDKTCIRFIHSSFLIP